MGHSTAPVGQTPILVAVDLSDLSERSALCLAHGCKMASKLGRSLVVAHIVHETTETAGMYRRQHGNRDTTPVHDIARLMLEERVADFRASGKRLYKECEIQLAIADGIPKTRILELAARYGAGVIVMCSRRETGLKRWLHGSVTESVIRHADCPVVVVGQRTGDFSPLGIPSPQTQRTATQHGI